MTFDEWWETSGLDGGRRVGDMATARLAWRAATERAAKLVEAEEDEATAGWARTPAEVARDIREGGVRT